MFKHEKETMYITKFYVAGRGRFPYDMMRYDSCRPFGPDDCAAVDSDIREERCIQMIMYGNAYMAPTVDRWRSFGWTVTSVPYDVLPPNR